MFNFLFNPISDMAYIMAERVQISLRTAAVFNK